MRPESVNPARQDQQGIRTALALSPTGRWPRRRPALEPDLRLGDPEHRQSGGLSNAQVNQFSRGITWNELVAEMTVPDFPPPTFQEAIRDPIYLAATAAPSVASFSSYHSVRTRTLSEISYPTTSASSPVDGSIYQDAFDDVADRNTSNSDSDSCELEMVSVDHYHAEWEDDRRQGLPLEERVRRDLERRKLAEPSPSVMSRERACSHCGASRTLNDSQSSIGVSAAPSTPEQQEPPNVAPAPVARRRLLRHKHSQSLSASVPSTPTSGSNQRSFPSSDPHRRSRSMSPTPRPGSPSSMFSHKPSLSSMSRRLFSSSRGKERSPTEEPLESWEVVPSGSSEAQNEVPVSRMRRSLSGMALSSRASSESSNTPTISPYPLQQTSMPQIPSEKNSSRFNLSSIQDRPPPPIPPAFQNRPIRAPPPAPPPLRQSPLATNVYSPFSESPAPSVSLPSPEVDPPSPKKSRRPPPPPSRKKPPSINAALAQRGTRQRFQSMSVPRTAPTVPFPPLSPTQDDRVSHMSRFRGYQANPFNPDPFPHDFRSSSPQSEVSYTTALSDQEDESKSKSSSLLTIRPQARGTYVNNSLARLRSPQTPTSPTLPALLVSPTSPVSPRSGHHYNGRPLPLPPPGSPITATPITQTHFGFGDEKAPIRLIDAQLNQNTGPSHNYPINPFNANFSRAQSPPLFDPSRMYAPVHVPTPPYVHPAPLIDARMYFPIYAPPPRTQSPAIFDASRLEAPVHIPGSFPMHTHVIVDASRLYSTVHAPTAARTQPLMPVNYPTLSASARVPPSPSSITSRSSVFEVQGAGQDNDYDSRYSTYTDDDTSTIQSEMTDLDALIARIDGESDDGGNYEVFLPRRF